MSGFLAADLELDTCTYLARHRELVSQLSGNIATVTVAPINGTDPRAITHALELAPCLRVPRDIVTMFCGVGLGHRLIPVARQDILGVTLLPTIDAHLADEDLRDIADDDHRHEIASLLRIWASMVEKPLGRCEADGWIGGRMVRGERGRARVLWPTLYPAFSLSSYAAHFDLFRSFDVHVGG